MVMRSHLPRGEPGALAKEEFMVNDKVKRLRQHVGAALPGRVTS
jgi:hypothetical protein